MTRTILIVALWLASMCAITDGIQAGTATPLPSLALYYGMSALTVLALWVQLMDVPGEKHDAPATDPLADLHL